MEREIELINGKFVVKDKKEAKPPEQKSPEQKPVLKQYSQEVLALRERVIKGNQKLFEAWVHIREIEDREERERQLNRWNEAQEKLHLLCSELKTKGYLDCLYLDENGKKTKACLSNPNGFWCQVCPSEILYWERELLDLPSAGGR